MTIWVVVIGGLWIASVAGVIWLLARAVDAAEDDRE